MAEQRRTKRFDLKLPVELLINGGGAPPTVCETRNMSSGGVLFNSAAGLQPGDAIEYLITLPASATGAAVRLRCMGKVMRSDPARPNVEGTHQVRPYSIAATLERYEFLRGKNSQNSH